MSNFYITSPAASPVVDNSRSEEFEKRVESTLKDIKENLKSTEIVTTASPPSPRIDFNKNYIEGLHNVTLEAIELMRLDVLTASDKSFTKTSTRIKESSDLLENLLNEVLKTSTDASSDAEAFFLENKKANTDLMAEVTSLDKVLLQASDNVLDTKKRLEYGIHEIVNGVGDIVTLISKEVNATILKRLDEIETTLADNHEVVMLNLTTKISTEMGQVWRQIGIMFQEISSSKQTLDGLQKMTELYVNGTSSTMDGMEGNVSQITERMVEIESNLNFLLGRLSLVTQEFNSIKTGLGSALDNIKNSFDMVQKNIQRVGPGPHPINEEEEMSKNNLFDRPQK